MGLLLERVGKLPNGLGHTVARRSQGLRTGIHHMGWSQWPIGSVPFRWKLDQQASRHLLHGLDGNQHGNFLRHSRTPAHLVGTEQPKESLYRLTSRFRNFCLGSNTTRATSRKRDSAGKALDLRLLLAWKNGKERRWLQSECGVVSTLIELDLIVKLINLLQVPLPQKMGYGLDNLDRPHLLIDSRTGHDYLVQATSDCRQSRRRQKLVRDSD